MYRSYITMQRSFLKLMKPKTLSCRKTDSDVALVMAFLVSENENKRLEDLPPPELDAYLDSFILSVRKKTCEKHKPTTLRGLIASL